jgi:hypothetical protein
VNPKQRATIPSELNALERAALAAARWSWALLTTISLSCNMNPVPEDPGVTQGDHDIPGFETGGTETTPGVGTVEGDGVSDEGDPGVGDPTAPSETTPSNAGSSPGTTGTTAPISPPATTTVPPTTTGTTPSLPDVEPWTGGEPAPGAMNDGGVDGGVPSEGGILFDVDAQVVDADAGEGGAL